MILIFFLLFSIGLCVPGSLHYTISKNKNHRLLINNNNKKDGIIHTVDDIDLSEFLDNRLVKRLNNYQLSPIYDQQDLNLLLNVSLGTPAQNFSLNLDTKGSDLWVYSSSVSKCTANSSAVENCTIGNETFNYKLSDSFMFPIANTIFNQSLIDGTVTTGVYGSDILQFINDNTTKMSNQTFGLANMSSSPFIDGSIGLGFAVTEGVNNEPQYPTVLANMVKNDLIYSQSYSIWLDDETSGSILFGAIDLNKFQDDLYVLPMDPFADDNNNYNYIFITSTGISVSNSNGQTQSISSSNNSLLPVLIDSGNPVSFLPYSIIVGIATQLNALYAPDLDLWVQSCQYKSINGSIDFHFYDTEINVPVTDILLEIYDESTLKPFTFSNGEPVCMLAFYDAEYVGFNTIGLSVLSSMYTFVDLDNYQVGISQSYHNMTNPNNDKHDIVVIANNITDASRVSLVTPSTTVPLTLAQPSYPLSDDGHGFPQIIISDGQFLTSNAQNLPTGNPNQAPTTRSLPEETGTSNSAAVLTVSLIGLLMYSITIYLLL